MVNEEGKEEKKGVSLDWLIGGVLSKIGDTFDRFTGRNWNPSSNLATSKLVEKLKLLLDSEVRELGKEGRFVPHVFKLKIQWNKFSTDSDDELRKLEHELHAAAIDHINDRLYHTYAPLEISVVKDYFVEGVQFAAGFGTFAENPDDEREVHITLANIPTGEASASLEEDDLPPEEGGEAADSRFALEYRVSGRKISKAMDFAAQKRYGVGRSAGNDIVIDDPSVSKSHASIAMTADGRIVVADTGSTNGTFISDVRIAYGKASEIGDGSVLKFGDVVANFTASGTPEENTSNTPRSVDDVREQTAIGKTADPVTSKDEPAPTVASINVDEPPPTVEGATDDWEI